MGAEDMQPGEIKRSLERIEKSIVQLSQDVQRAIGLVSSHEAELKNLSDDMKTLQADVKEVTKTANKIAGFGALGAVLVGLLPWPWKK